MVFEMTTIDEVIGLTGKGRWCWLLGMSYILQLVFINLCVNRQA